MIEKGLKRMTPKYLAYVSLTQYVVIIDFSLGHGLYRKTMTTKAAKYAVTSIGRIATFRFNLMDMNAFDADSYYNL